jgi:trk system potassium uptake protein TrkH
MRQRAYLRQRYRALLAYAGEVIAIIGVLYLVPLLLLVAYPSEAVYAGGFIVTGLPLLVCGYALWRNFAPQEKLTVNVQEAYVIVAVVWLTAVLSGAVPFIINSGLTFSQALFESTSGWTTTGLTVVNVEQAPRLILFYRTFLQWAGGAGFAIITVSAIGVIFGSGLSVAEGRAEQLAPHVRNSARIVLRLYIGYAIVGILALRVAGMSWFDAIVHALSALSTGGFSSRSASIGHYDSALIEAIIIVLMMLGAISFVSVYLLIQRRFRVVSRDGELRFMALVWIGAIFLLFSFVTVAVYPSVERAIRVAAFEVTSALTGAGFTISNPRAWPDFGWMLLIIVMLMGGGSGSTAGGMKQFRLYILYKALVWEIRRAFMPRHMVNEPAIWHGERRYLMHDREVRQVALFICLYLSFFLAGSGLFTAYGFTLKESLFEFASAIGNAGISVGVTTPQLPAPLLIFQSFAMLLGRLEFFALIIGVIKLGADARVMLSSSN